MSFNNVNLENKINLQFTKIINLSKYPYLRIIKFLPLREQFILINYNRRLRSIILSYSKMLKVLFQLFEALQAEKGNKVISLLKIDNVNEKRGQLVNLQDKFNKNNYLSFLFENDFKLYFAFIEHNFGKTKLTEERKSQVACYLLKKIIKNHNLGETTDLLKEFHCLDTNRKHYIINFDKFNIVIKGLEIINLMFNNSEWVSKLNYKFKFHGLNLSKNKLSQFNFDSFINLKYLNLSNNSIDDMGIDKFLSKLIHTPSYSLHSIYLDNNNLTDITGEKLYDIFSINKNLKIISSYKNKMNHCYDTIFSLRYFHSVNIINLSNGNLDDEKVKIIFNEIFVGNKNNLANIETLNLNDNNITEKSSEFLFQFLSSTKNLKFLDIKNNEGIFEETQNYIKTILELRWGRIVNLNNIIINFEINDDSIFRMIEALSTNTNVSFFTFENFKNINSEYLSKIIESLKNCVKLTSLNLSGNNIKDELIASICDLIPNLKSLNKLDLSNNQISNTGAKIILDLYKSSNKIQLSRINFENNKIDVINKEILSFCNEMTLNFNYMKICTATLKGHTVGITCLISLADGSLASGSWDGSIKIWDPKQNYKCIATLRIKGPMEYVYSLLLLPNNKLASGSGSYFFNNSIKIWDLKGNNNKYLASLEGHEHVVHSLILLPDLKIASGSWDSTIRIWDILDNYKCKYILKGHCDDILSLLFLPNWNIASGSTDKTIKIWNISEGYKCIETLIGHEGGINSLILLPEWKIASGSHDHTIRVWNCNDNFDCIYILSVQSNLVNTLLLLSSGKIAIGSGSKDGIIRIMNPKNDNRYINKLRGHDDAINCVILLPDDKIASGSSDLTIKIWD